MKGKGSYKVGDPNIDQEIERLAKKYSLPQTRNFIRELFTTVVKLHLDNADERDLYLINMTLKELRHIFRTFARYRCVRKVVMFGSHRSSPETKEYKMAVDFAREIVKKDFMVITGGGGGVMEAATAGQAQKVLRSRSSCRWSWSPTAMFAAGKN
ncbi:hypothetical protein ACFL37_02245 [Candidatus Margulisiibacteriota bacterium]